MKELPKAYEPKHYEDEIYKRWEESGFFNPDNLSGEPYAIMMPPPNVTGVLHLGHALENSLMDSMARFQRMRGKKVLLLPGTDHAAVATQAKVERLLVEQGIKNPRQELGREELLRRIREFSEQSKSTILSQIKKMGTSADWSRLAYTFDEPRNRAVNGVFVRMYNDGLIYRGTRMVNWSIGAHSVLSDDELLWEERQEPFYYIRCGEFVIGTVRPETKCADSPLVVHGDGEYLRLRFTNKEGQEDHLIVSKNLFDKKEQFQVITNHLESQSNFQVTETFTGKELEGRAFEYDTYAAKRKFYVIADEVIDMEKGAGAMTISSCHSADDYDLAKRRGLNETFIQKIDFDGKMTDVAGPCIGMTIVDARRKAVEIMKEMGLIVGEDTKYVHRLPICYRSNTVVEPMVSKQWFVNVDKEIPGRGKTLKQLMREAVTTGHNGDKNKTVRITPDRFEKGYLRWVDNLYDWCISRQIWWGHQIPVWYKGEEVYVGIEPPKDEEKWERDPDTLDTWFSSGMWTFSTLGWPEGGDFKTFHPTGWMQMGYEILFLWMSRMILFSTYVIDGIPFRDVYIHGMLRDEMGKKFSKSAGNSVDPLDVIEEFGTDALRFSLISGISPGNDARFYDEKVEGARNLVNKIWNISRFILTQFDPDGLTLETDHTSQEYTLADQWILMRLNQIIIEVTDDLENFRFSAAGEKLRDFTWSELADWYLEISKIESASPADKSFKSGILMYILEILLKLWHPFMPFVTEAIYQQRMRNSGILLMVQPWPSSVLHAGLRTDKPASEVLSEFSLLQSIVTGIRTIRNEYGIEPKKEFSIIIQTEKYQVLIDQYASIIKNLAKVSSLTITGTPDQPKQSATFVPGEGVTVFVELSDVIDVAKERERLEKEIQNLTAYVSSLEKKLANKQFVAQAPASVVATERAKYEEATAKLSALEQQRAPFSHF
ncbi:MAG TPA: hypothetical protein DCY48_03540 [Candidatus Magasanikbacteria bacterium]|nr:MAG: hypothetical protein A3I74_04735 [Candidatus Magasanikbacteria bacterium RIFCSPLOWO2_02_FULL_47_16]OGH79512.1 MAG: hypothetical protein A3C10_01705 [Candidatus Magasanikbacteria bacterium RIFCSPHIGHO2_02_FULL_48_18]OGH81954.1 MAG: hypothetical protein A3G08_01980 [Candidatus Magasanikbacteria bacterium RIFCSPLOWO2_12_FULL_47_9b]HAZ28817.1 hypothetical protein [Candidatus Magasanikbacteria bacterium]